MSYTLSGTALANVQQERTSYEWLGGAVTLASGAIRRDLVQAGAKRRWSLSWTALTAGELGTVTACYGAAVAGDVAFTAPDVAGTATVNAGERPGLTTETYTIAQGELRYRCSLELWEV